MKRRLVVTPRARRDIDEILSWYRANLGARAALRVARTFQGRLLALEAGRVAGALYSPDFPFRRVVARKHVILFLSDADVLRIVRVVHGSQDIEALIADLGERD